MSLSLFCEKTWTVGWLDQGLGDKSFKMILCFNPSTLYTSTLYINLIPQIDITQGRSNHSIVYPNNKELDLGFNVKGSNREKWHRVKLKTLVICSTVPTLTLIRASCTTYKYSWILPSCEINVNVLNHESIGTIQRECSRNI